MVPGTKQQQTEVQNWGR